MSRRDPEASSTSITEVRARAVVVRAVGRVDRDPGLADLPEDLGRLAHVGHVGEGRVEEVAGDHDEIDALLDASLERGPDGREAGLGQRPLAPGPTWRSARWAKRKVIPLLSLRHVAGSARDLRHAPRIYAVCDTFKV